MKKNNVIWFQELIDKVSKIGIDKENDITMHDNIMYANLLSLASSVALFFTAILLFLFINNPLCASACLLASFNPTVVWYCNYKGKSLAGRLYLYFSAIVLLLLYSMIFSHKTTLDTYFIAVCLSPVLMFSPKERKWLLITYFFTFAALIIEWSSLEDYLPNFHLLEVTPMVNYSVLVGLVLMMLSQLGLYAYIQREVQKRLLTVNNNLEQARSELENYSKDLEVFGMTATHDLKAPISISRVFLQIVEKSIYKPDIDKAEIMESIASINSTYVQMETLIDSYLSYIRVLQLSTLKEQVLVKSELFIIAQNLHRIYPHAKILFPESDTILLTGKVLFITVMQNLIHNGLKYNKSSTPTVIINITKDRNKIIFSINDNGIGIDPKFNEELFMPFRRFNSAIEGTGLGLTISKRATQKMNGILYCAESNKDGTTFILELPLVVPNNTSK